MCGICKDEKFKSEEEVDAHGSREHFIRWVCGTRHESRAEQVKHWVLTQHNNYYCPLCRDGFSSKNLYQSHSCTGHTSYECRVCHMVGPSQATLDSHWKDAVNNHTASNPHRQLLCRDSARRKLFNSLQGLDHHLRSDNGDVKEGPVFCRGCYRNFRKVSSFSHVEHSLCCPLSICDGLVQISRMLSTVELVKAEQEGI